MYFWLVPLSSYCAGLLLVVESVVGSGGDRLRNGALGGTNAGRAGVAEFWVLAFGASRGDITSAGDGIASTENL